jgi:L-histidine N-alpha-methyltransferase
MSMINAPVGERASPYCEFVPPTRAVPSLVDDVREGLLASPRSLPPKYFYDDNGSRLFDAICDTEEYYPTRTEDALLKRSARDIIASLQPEHMVELGSGTSRKTRRLLDACEEHGCHATYWPFDVCESMVQDSAEALMDEYEWLHVRGLVGDYHAGFEHFPGFDGRSLFVFLGSTIGNLEHDYAVDFLQELRSLMGADDSLLIGADRVKDSDVLHAAYNDSEGLTAEFNRNVLRVLNREVDANFEPDAFEHRAIYNREQSRIEMHLVSTCAQTVCLTALDETIEFRKGESILTEISRKFTPDSLGALLSEAGFRIERHYEPGDGFFSLVLASPVAD